MREHLSGTSDTSHMSGPSQDRGCPCGRTHSDQRKRSAEREHPVFNHRTAANAASSAASLGKLEYLDGRAVLHFEQDCEKPIDIDGLVRKPLVDDQSGRRMTYRVRCRNCSSCLRAKMRYWIAAAVHQSDLTEARGDRTWFGTLTFRPEVQTLLLDEAQRKWSEELATSSAVPTWWDDPLCDYRFSLVRDEVVGELQKYWKRLRKAGHKFTYFVAIERHKSGLPHLHWLLHEQGAPIRKRQLDAAWGLGHSQVRLLPISDRRRVSAYVAKYLSKSRQARQIASQGYKPRKDAPAARA